MPAGTTESRQGQLFTPMWVGAAKVGPQRRINSQREAAFFNFSQARVAPQQNARNYGGWVPGRSYVQSAPIGLQGGRWSTYGYAGANPLSYVDGYGSLAFMVHRGSSIWYFSQSLRRAIAAKALALCQCLQSGRELRSGIGTFKLNDAAVDVAILIGIAR